MPRPDGQVTDRSWAYPTRWRRYGGGADSARVTLTALYPRVGFLEPTDAECKVNEIAQSFPTERHTADVPLYQLRGTEPFTVYLTGSHVWTTDLDGNPAQVEFAWEYHVVLQRIV